MKYEYNGFTKEQLLLNPKIPIICLEHQKDVFFLMAEEMVNEIEKNNRLKKNTVFICPVGPIGQYDCFVEMVNHRRTDLKHTWFINMDEYLDHSGKWISSIHPFSFRGFMERQVYDKIDPELVMKKEQRVFPDPDHIAYIPELIKDLGGVDIVFGGIGINGHVAFNEPDRRVSAEDFLKLGTRILPVAGETKTVAGIENCYGAIEECPDYCITIGMKEIMGGKKIRLACFKDWHRGVVRRAAYGNPSSEFPVTLLQAHSDIQILIPENVAIIPQI